MEGRDGEMGLVLEWKNDDEPIVIVEFMVVVVMVVVAVELWFPAGMESLRRNYL